MLLLILLLDVGRMVTGERWAVQRRHWREGLTTGGRAILSFYGVESNCTLTRFELRYGVGRKGKTGKGDRGTARGLWLC